MNTDGDRSAVGVKCRTEISLEPDRVGREEQRIFVENDGDWVVEGCDLERLQNQHLTFGIGSTLEDDKERWVQLKEALGRKDSPNILATRK